MAKKAKESQEMTNKEKREKMVEVQTSKRVFDTEKYGLLQIRFPLVEENRLADWEYSKVFHQAIMDEIPTNKETEAMIKKRNLWTEEDESQIVDLRSQIDVQLVLLSKMETEKNIKPIQDKIDELRQHI